MSEWENEFNPFDCLTKDRTDAIERAITASNEEVVQVGLSVPSFHAWKPKDLSGIRRTCFTRNLQIKLKKLPGVEIVEVGNVLLIIFDRKVAMYVRKIPPNTLLGGVPKLFSDKERIIITETQPTQIPLTGFDELLNIEPELKSISHEDALRVKDVVILLCGYIADDPGMVERVYITHQIHEFILGKVEIDPSKAKNITYLGHTEAQEEEEEEGPSIFGIDDPLDDSDTMDEDSDKAVGDG